MTALVFVVNLLVVALPILLVVWFVLAKLVVVVTKLVVVLVARVNCGAFCRINRARGSVVKAKIARDDLGQGGTSDRARGGRHG